MTLPLLLGVGALGGLGALARFLIGGFIVARRERPFPLGTLVVNLSGAFALGLLLASEVSGDTYRLLGTGLLGAYTTFSTWMYQSHHLAGEGRRGLAALNVAGSLALGLLAAWAGRSL